MEEAQFDALTARLAAPLSRRRSVSLLAVLGWGGLTAASNANAKKKKKRKKKPKPAVACTPSCDRKVCGGDGCGGTCGECDACHECQAEACVAKANGAACGDACHQCQGGVCVALAEGSTCGVDSCQTCQGGQCVVKLDGAACSEFRNGLCRRGTCRNRPLCVSNSENLSCGFAGNCCYQNEGDTCPGINCDRTQKGGAGHRCKAAADCASGSCLAYECV